MEYGYARVSTREQNEERQLIALRAFGIAESAIFVDKQSGEGFRADAVPAADAQVEGRRYACRQEHRPSWAQL